MFKFIVFGIIIFGLIWAVKNLDWDGDGGSSDYFDHTGGAGGSM